MEPRLDILVSISLDPNVLVRDQKLARHQREQRQPSHAGAERTLTWQLRDLSLAFSGVF